MAVNSVKIEGLLGMITVKLHEDNFVKWSYQFSSVLRGYDLFDFFNGESQCPPKYCITPEGGVTKEISTAYKQWIQQDLALLSLLIATLSDEVMDHVIGCKTAQEAWEKLQDRFASISVVRVNQLKTEFHTAQKGSDSVDKFLFRLKVIKDQLVIAGERITDNDLMIDVLSGLPPEYEVIKTIILARDTSISLKDFRAQLIGVEGSLETRLNTLARTMSAMYVNGDLSNGQGGYQSFEQGESSNSQKFNGQGSFNGGSGFAGNSSGQGSFNGGSGFATNSGGRSFQQRSTFNNNRRGNNTSSRSYSNFGNRPYGFSESSGSSGFNGSVDNQKGSYCSSSNVSSGFTQGSKWNGNTNYKSAISPECQICSRRGHTAPNCYYRTINAQGNFRGPIFCQICGKKGHTAIQCYHRNNYSYQGPPPPQSLNPTPVGMAAQAPNTTSVVQNVHGFSNADTWVVDTGATHHMTANLEHINQATPYNGDSKITIGNGEGLVVKNIGASEIVTNNHTFVLNHVLHVPLIAMNLLSVKKLCKDNGCWFICDDVVFFIQDKATRVILYQGKSDDGELFKIPVSVFRGSFAAKLEHCGAFLGKKVTSSIWHKRLGHPTEEVLSTMLKTANVSVNKDSCSTICSACISGKMCKLPFSVKQVRTTQKFEKIHSDVWGPSPQRSIEGYRYYVSFVDDFSRFVWIFPMTNKSDVFQIFAKFYAFVHTQFRHNIQHATNGVQEEDSVSSLPDNAAIQSSSPRFYVPVMNNDSESQSRDSGTSSLVSQQHQASYSPHHHSGTSSMLPVHTESQLQVILPFPSQIEPSSHIAPSTDINSSESIHQMVTRLKSGVIPRQDYSAFIACFPELHSLQLTEEDRFSGGYSFVSAITDISEPNTFRKAASLPQWQQAMQEEYDSLRSQGTWVLVSPPKDRSIVGSKWVYKVKKNPDGSVSRYKARLVAQGFSQEQGVDYSDTFSPVVRHTTVRVVLALAASNHWKLRQLDIKNAFLHGDLQEEIYMKQPQGFVDASHPNYVCKLIKSLYGLKQAPRAWNSKFTSYLFAMNFQASVSDTSLFIKKDDGDIVVLLLYVDDIILTGSNSVKIQKMIDELSEVFELKDMGQLTYFLGLQISYQKNGDIFVSQSKYIKDVIHKAGMDTCKPAITPCKPHDQMLLSEGSLMSDPSLYRSIVGSLQYLTFTRPDIAYAVNKVCQFMNSPTEMHYAAVKRILRYLHGTLHHGIVYSAADPIKSIAAFSDADWAADINTRRSNTGYIVYLGNNPVSWQSKKQCSVSRSSTEAEYKALAHTAADVAWIRGILKDLDVFLPSPPIIHCDNMSAIALTANPVFHSRIKHLDTDFHFVRERVQQGDLEVVYIPTEDQTADVLTKGLHNPAFLRHCYDLRLSTPSTIEGEC